MVPMGIMAISPTSLISKSLPVLYPVLRLCKRRTFLLALRNRPTNSIVHGCSRPAMSNLSHCDTVVWSYPLTSTRSPSRNLLILLLFVVTEIIKPPLVCRGDHSHPSTPLRRRFQRPE